MHASIHVNIAMTPVTMHLTYEHTYEYRYTCMCMRTRIHVYYIRIPCVIHVSCPILNDIVIIIIIWLSHLCTIIYTIGRHVHHYTYCAPALTHRCAVRVSLFCSAHCTNTCIYMYMYIYIYIHTCVCIYVYIIIIIIIIIIIMSMNMTSITCYYQRYQCKLSLLAI